MHCYTQCPQPCSRPQLTYTSTGNAQTQFCVSLCECPESWYTQGLFEPSERLWQEQSLILKVSLPLLPSCWGFSFPLRYSVSPHSCSRAYCLTGIFLTLEVGYLFTAIPEKCRCHSWPGTWVIFSGSLLLTLDVRNLLSGVYQSNAMQLPFTTPNEHILT